ncbi:hypothetical protein N7G274_001442 [Stereocaulon virgatum]|uniref:J domain-containing protein n=1 Tax=Stereocaulon virgatum TaxID=373712 RepID=A0ABR4AJP8_9LECA
MRIPLLILFVSSALLALVAGFTKEDHEIFRLRDELAATEGPEVTFYDFLGVKYGASQDEIGKAYRTKSRKIHPDKAKQSFIASRARATASPRSGHKSEKPAVHVNKAPSDNEIHAAVKKASERYARLGVITEILKGPGRERYDYFLSNGFPKWRGTGYYYARFRPGLGSVLVGLFTFGGGLVHYGAMYLSWKRRRDFVERLIRDSRKAAWGDESGIRGIPGVDGTMTGTTATPPPQTFAQGNGAAVLNRRQKRTQEKESKREDKKSKGYRRSGTSTPLESETEPGPQGTKKKVQAPNGKVMIVDSIGNVFLEEEDEHGSKQEFLLDPNQLPKPTFRQTILFQIPAWTYHTIKGRISSAQLNEKQAELASLEVTKSGEEDGATQEPKSSVNGLARKRGKRNSKLQ